MDHLQKEFSRIYDQYIGKIYRFVFLRVNSTEAAQDLTSETFVRAWDRFKTGGSGPKVKNWAAFLYQIARNLVTDFYREKGKIQIVSASYVADPNPALDLENRAFLNSDVEQIKEALSRLGEEHQEVIIWRYLDGLSNKEIAEILDKPEGTVRVIIHRALEALRQELGEA
ncbi:MAG: RNA polymerase, sigma-24 subunit, ECF subfamily [Candidatus Kaiserbacteria bacterium GW2011_GWA2_49_19]|uniref:RNA polymerase, sigma-24 subunit, ECF subfamily n=1 Tax=Candidatus Kaiserbacteria bacterium GW2011_GWA2_49_19 TaxID=1618669 RepID=A0A0G1VPM4_9BACT|nr:MAG: RNA polymerase, sigma-24 subunit, ECF subfamily [Candidatus Kaiserbacteria bacterium GW2011_GWA2_49_19]